MHATVHATAASPTRQYAATRCTVLRLVVLCVDMSCSTPRCRTVWLTRRAGDLGLSGTSVAAAARAEVKAAPREERVQSVADHKLGSVRTATRCNIAQRPGCPAAQRGAMQHEVFVTVLQHSRACCNAVHLVVGWQAQQQSHAAPPPACWCAVPIAGRIGWGGLPVAATEYRARRMPARRKLRCSATRCILSLLTALALHVAVCLGRSIGVSSCSSALRPSPMISRRCRPAPVHSAGPTGVALGRQGWHWADRGGTGPTGWQARAHPIPPL